jgi:ABC-2 type transport system ATP-binding protein
MKEPIITTDRLTKRYKDVTAVSDVSLTVGKGEIYGFLGLNGAGKTTTIRLLLGMIRPTSGSAVINGQKVYPDNLGLWKEIGYLVEVPYSYPNLTVRENLEITRRLRQVPDRGVVGRVIGLLKLDAYAGRKAKNLSLGNAQRLGLAKALMHDPSILMLDEPANGLDPEGIYEIRELLTDLAENRGVTIFISSHILGEISRFATRIGIIHEGRLIREVTAGQLEGLCRKRLLVGAGDLSMARSVLEQKGYAVDPPADGLIALTGEESIRHPEAVATLLVNAGCPPSRLNVVEEDLESYFLRTIRTEGARS